MSELLEGDSAPEKKLEFKDFEEALGRLEAIVGRLEAGDLALEEAVNLFEEGMQISRFCGDRLDEAERKVEILVKNARGEATEEPFDAVESESEDE
ncbi:MAG: exodeoxyribonuclease VII small subunit [Acidobacteriota bacterium]|jgi:exodeoxyribonuclease VII small subunit